MKPAKQLLVIIAIVAMPMAGCSSREGRIKDAVIRDIQNHPQQLFNAFHPIGTAKNVAVHSVDVYGNNIDVVCTIYWAGPITQDGYTKVAMHYDGDVKRWTQYQILATNGITNQQANQAAFDIGWEIGRSLSEDQ